MYNGTKKIILGIVLLLLVAGAAYWYFFMRTAVSPSLDTNNSTSSGFVPFGRNTSGGNNQPGSNPAQPTQSTGTSTTPSAVAPIPKLRLLSDTPVGGYGASTTATTTVVRWIDRGRGNIYEAKENSLDVLTISNTVLPRVYESAWNKNLTAFIGSILSDGNSLPSTVYAEILKQTAKTASSTSTNADVVATPFNLKGKNLPNNIIGYALSPKKDKLFVLINENGAGVGYVSAANGSSVVQIFTAPLTQLNVEWPEENTIALTTKGSASDSGFLYFVNPKTGSWTKILGPVTGMSTRISHDGKYVLVSATGPNNTVTTTIYDVAKKSSIDAVIHTIADACAWGNFYKNVVYCGVPSQPVSSTYPDSWYRGTISWSDKIWQVNASTGELHLVSSLIDQADRSIDAYNLGLDEKDNYLVFMNKNDLSLWSLDLVMAQ